MPLILLQPFAPPTHYTGRAQVGAITIEGELRIIHAGGLTPAALNATYGEDNWYFRVDWDALALPRMIGKIAHGMAVALVGVDGFESWVCRSVIDVPGDIGRWVGCLPGRPFNGPDGLHGVSLAVDNNEIHAYVRLFAQLGAQEYFVVVGRLNEIGDARLEGVTERRHTVPRDSTLAEPN